MNMIGEWRSRSMGQVVAGHVSEWWHSMDTEDPWPEEIDIAVRAAEAMPVCHRCMTPCALPAWFCPDCGVAVGPYNNVMPFLPIFSLGEVLRSGVGPEARFTWVTVPGYLVVGTCTGLLIPLYYIRLLMNGVRMGRRRSAP